MTDKQRSRRADASGEAIDEVFVFPASYAQQRLWFLDQWEPGSAAYNVPAALRLTGALDLHALERSLCAIVARHEVLRTRFGLEDGLPVQLICPSCPVGLCLVDLTTVPPADREAEALRLATAEANRPFDLSLGPLVRATALRLAPDEHVLLVTLHHIVFDGWSMGVLFRELTICYNALAAGVEPSLPPLPIQYADYTMWQREWLQGEVLEGQLAYWRRQLGGGLSVLQLPTDHPRPAVLTSRGGSHPIRLSRTLADQIMAVSRRERATLFMTLVAAFQALLFRYSGQDDVVVGAAIAGRNQLELENLIGFFVNTLVLRASFAGNPTFRGLLHQVRDVTIGAYAHQDLPFEKLVEELHPTRSSSHAPLTQAVFVLQNTPRHPLELRGLTAAPFELSFEATKFDMSLSLREGPEGLNGSLVYSTDLFEASTIARMAAHYEALLNGVCRDPDCRVSELPLLDEAERHRLVVEWNDTARRYPRDECVHVLFEAQAARAPDAIAVVCGNARTSYAALNRRANQIARWLRERGVGAEARVAVCAPRSIDLVAALLGIWKAGGAYVPLDPADPPERLAFMLSDAGVRLVVTDTHAGKRLPDLSGIERLYLDRGSQTFERERTENLGNDTTADSLAYVMYTSGSTGAPKAVAVVHRGIVRLVKETSYVSIAPDDVMLQAAPVTFDASTFELWGALLNGARLAQAPVDKPSLAELGETLERDGVTIAWLTSGLFNQMVEHELDRLRHVRHVLAGGDVLSVAHVRKFLQAPGAGTLTNGYGPTENTTFTCCYSMRAATDIGASVPIGRPISNTQVYVLDAQLTPQPIGVTGELYVGGDGLARGYWNRPELTAATFIANPFSEVPGSRLYKTGDRVRYRADGHLEFLGRVDHQVKIRGYRVELEEIEAALTRHASVREAAVMAREVASGDKRLVAYVVTPDALDPGELRHYLSQHLPEYMVPASFILLDALPKTPAGKVDRRSLPVKNVTGVELCPQQREPNAPRNQTEEQLLGLWRQVLGRDQIGIDDNFFELGGHSLLATQVVARIRSELGKELPLRALFEAPTVAALAARLADGPRERAGREPAPVGLCLVSLQPHGTKPPFFCVHGIGGEVQGYVALAQRLDPNRPFIGLRTPPLPTDGAFPRIEALAALYVEELLKAVPSGPYLLGGYSSGATVAFEMAQQLQALGKQVAKVVALDSNLPNNHGSVRVSPRVMADYLRNLLWWMVDDFMHAGRGEIRARLRSKAKVLGAKLAALPGLRWLPFSQPDIRDILGMPAIPQEWGPFLEAHYKSFMAYVPRPYSGRITLVKARSRPLTRLHEADLGWSRMAKGGVDVTIVPGSHETILQEPHVRALASALKRTFDEPEKTS